jgi:hypothetical protein
LFVLYLLLVLPATEGACTGFTGFGGALEGGSLDALLRAWVPMGAGLPLPMV